MMRRLGRGCLAAATALDTWLAACRNWVTTCLSLYACATPIRRARCAARARSETANLASACTFGFAAACFAVMVSREARWVALLSIMTALRCLTASSEMRSAPRGCRRAADKPAFLICLFIVHLLRRFTGDARMSRRYSYASAVAKILSASSVDSVVQVGLCSLRRFEVDDAILKLLEGSALYGCDEALESRWAAREPR